jgi:hypothetical protein
VTALKNYGALLLNVTGLGAALAMMLIVSYYHNLRLDLTPNQQYTLSQHTLRILDEVQKPVKILAFVRKEDPRNAYLTDLFWRIGLRQPKITSRVVDLNRNPALAQSYHADSYGSVVVECGPRRKTFSNVREELLTAAILQVTRDYEKTVYILSGHGERDTDDADRFHGYSTFRNVLEQEFYHVKPLALFGNAEIPKDAAAILIPGPRRDLLPEETLKLDRYVQGGGSILVLLDPGASASMSAFLHRYRVDAPARVIGDDEERLAGSEPLTAKIPEKVKDSSITSILDADPVFSLFGPIDISEGEEAKIDVLPVLSSSRSSWSLALERDGKVPENVEYDPKRGDKRGPFPVGVSVAIRLDDAGAKSAAGDEAVRKVGRLIVFSDSDFASNQFIDLLGNRDLLVNAVNWLALEDTLIGVRPERKVAGKEQFYVSSRQNYMVFLVGVVIMPLIFVALGMTVFVRRRLN